MRRAAAVFLSSALTFSPLAGFAAEGAAGPVFNIMGPSTCAGWPKSGKVESAAKAVPLNWVLGFAGSEAERTDPRMFELLQPEKVDAFLTRYCGAHPTDNLPIASKALIADLKDQLPPLAPPPPPEPPMFVPPVAQTAQKPAAKRPAARRPAARKPAAKKPAG